MSQVLSRKLLAPPFHWAKCLGSTPEGADLITAYSCSVWKRIRNPCSWCPIWRDVVLALIPGMCCWHAQRSKYAKYAKVPYFLVCQAQKTTLFSSSTPPKQKRLANVEGKNAPEQCGFEHPAGLTSSRPSLLGAPHFVHHVSFLPDLLLNLRVRYRKGPPISWWNYIIRN